ncbi:aspartate aminotransferase [Salmonella enterica subsp. enterica serovar Choleraesuis]|nr:aspartate aminotransferase [Salmonella enterica subsp. enterica serovar Choleraesuis]
MTFNFDESIDRHHSDSVKWNKFPENILPMWVADTDFRSPPCITEALKARIEHGVFGYGIDNPEFIDVTLAHLERSYGWRAKAEWLVPLPGLVCGLNLCVRSFTHAQQGTIAPTPIYPPFRKAAALAGRSQVNAPLRLSEGRWVVDLNAAPLTGNERLLMLCNPQNPAGTVYRRAELEQHLAFAQRHDLIVCSDEIHSELLLEPGVSHIPFATLSEDAAQRSITLISPSKSYNIAGLGASMAVIPNPELRARFVATAQGIVPHVDILALVAASAAWREGAPWLAAQNDYLRRNRDELVSAVNALPGLTMYKPEAGYLGWMDVSGLGIDNPARFFRQAGLGFSAGIDFGEPQFMRVNFGCTRATLNEAIRRLNTAVNR